MDYFLKRKYSF